MKSSALVAALALMLLAGPAFAAANSASVDHARDRVGQIVYPLGVHPPADTGTTQGVPAKDKTSTTPTTTTTTTDKQ
jgi:hypothetical protein